MYCNEEFVVREMTEEELAQLLQPPRTYELHFSSRHTTCTELSKPGAWDQGHNIVQAHNLFSVHDHANSTHQFGGRRRRRHLCKFCRKNGETKKFYEGHDLHDKNGKKVLCPILRQYTCPLCHATGDDAHTIKYCPVADTVPYEVILRARMMLEMSNKRCRTPPSPQYYREFKH